MILAAGKGTRLRPLTDTCPKPLIKIKQKPLIVYHLENLAKCGITQIVINLFHLGEEIRNYLGRGEKWGVEISYSVEPSLLEVGGGISNALPLLGENPFIIVNGDIWVDYPFDKLPSDPVGLGHLVLVDNPAHHPNGDFVLGHNQSLSREISEKRYTYSGIAVLRPELFEGCQKGTCFKLAPLFDQAIERKQLFGEHYSGNWFDIGTLERLQNLENTI